MPDYSNGFDVMGYQCRFVRVGVGRQYRIRGRKQYARQVYGVFLNDVFIGTIQEFDNTGWHLVAQLPDAQVTVIRGPSRVKAVTEYVCTHILSRVNL